MFAPVMRKSSARDFDKSSLTDIILRHRALKQKDNGSLVQPIFDQRFVLEKEACKVSGLEGCFRCFQKVSLIKSNSYPPKRFFPGQDKSILRLTSRGFSNLKVGV